MDHHVPPDTPQHHGREHERKQRGEKILPEHDVGQTAVLVLDTERLGGPKQRGKQTSQHV
jgi:hypothetical protein